MTGSLWNGTGAGDVLAIAATGGSTKRTLPDRLAEIKNVKDFGAVGDGVADDTAAIQATIDWVSGATNRGIVFFPAGTYKITSALSIPYNANFILRGTGRTSFLSANFNGFVIDQLSVPYSAGANVCVIENLYVVNSYAGQNFTRSASSSWAAGSSKTINVPGLDSAITTKCLVYILDQRIAPMPVLVASTTSVVAGTSITLDAAVGSSGLSDLTLVFVQSYAATADWAQAATAISMGGSPPAGVPTKCLAYDYDRILFGDGTNANVWTQSLGVSTWSGSSVSVPNGAAFSGVSGHRLVFAPLAGGIRFSSSVSGVIRDCYITGFIGVTTSQDNYNTSGQEQGAQSYSVRVEGCNLTSAAHSAAIGSTAIYLTNNSTSFYNEFSAWWCGVRTSGTCQSVIGGRIETCTYGIACQADQDSGNSNGQGVLLASLSMESNAIAILSYSSEVQINSVRVICQNSYGQQGVYIAGGTTALINSQFSGHWTGYGLYIRDPNTTPPAYITAISTYVTNLDDSSRNWRVPSLPWWGTCIQCNNPALVYTYANLPGVFGGTTAPAEGDEYSISDGAKSGGGAAAFGDALQGSGTGHYKARYNGTNWTRVG